MSKWKIIVILFGQALKISGKSGEGHNHPPHFSAFNGPKTYMSPEFCQIELGQFDFWFKFGSRLKFSPKFVSFMILTMKYLQDFLILIRIHKIGIKEARD